MDVPFASVVIPVLHDTDQLAGLLAALHTSTRHRDVHVPDPVFEVIVVNGDDRDRSVADTCLQFPGVHVIPAPPGRARQMNIGAAQATGRWLLFLHADTQPDPDWLREIRRVDQRQTVVAGALCFTLRSDALAARVVEWGVAWRVRWLGLPYGDQGLFVRRELFHELGGYPVQPLMEDVALVRRLRRRGRVCASAVPIYVSARRWERDGWVRRTLENLGLLVLYTLGVSTDRLADRYYPTRRDAAGAAVGAGACEAADSRAQQPDSRIAVVMPALNEEEAIGSVLAELPAQVGSVTVVDNGSTDATAEQARRLGAQVVSEPRRGYGRACLAALRHPATAAAEVIVFLDADRSDYPRELTRLVEPILNGKADFVLGARDTTNRPLVARIGTAICVELINLLWGTRYRDLGPFRAIRRSALDGLGMADETWGWTIEMQIKAAEQGLRTLEVPVRQRPRLGRSKISGTLTGVSRAGTRMLVTIWILWRTRDHRVHAHA